MNDHTLIAEAVLGKDAEEFLSSELGRYLIGRSGQEAETAMGDLKVVEPMDADRIRALQNIIWRAESFKGWLVELINQGRLAEQALDE